MAHPSRTPIDKWPQGWCALECASLLDNALYLTMYESEKREKDYPVTIEEMRDFIKSNRSTTPS